MTVRTHSDKKTNASFEAISLRIGGLERNIAAMNAMMQSIMAGNTISKPTPNLPFKVDEEATSEGIFITISVQIPSNTGVLRVQLIRKFDNQVQGSETDEEAIARAKTKIKRFVIDVNESERTSGLVVREIGPLPPKEDTEKNKYQLVRLIAVNRDEDARSDNPTSDPTTTIPFETLVVRSDGGSDENNKFFTIGVSGVEDAPSVPDSTLIVSNAVNLETQAADATVRFKVFAKGGMGGLGDGTTTFADEDIESITVVLRPFAQAADASGETDSPIRETVTITDRTKTFTFVDIDLPLGKQYKWVKNVTRNAAGSPQVATPASTVSFYAGGTIPSAGITELSTFTISAVQRNNTHTVVTITLKQPDSPALAILLKRIIITVTEPGGSAEIVEKIPLLDQEDVFVQGATTTFKRKIQHRASLTGITYGATVFAVNYRASDPALALLKRDATNATGNSTFSTRPSDPSLSRLSTAPDDDTAESDAYADFTVFADATNSATTFASVGADEVVIVLRRTGNTVTTADESDTQNLLPKYVFPIEDTSVTNATFRVPRLKLGRQYEWRRNILRRSGAVSKSTGAAVTFRAGEMVTTLAGVSIALSTPVQEKKRHARVIATVTQSSPMAANLKNITLFQDVNDGAGFRQVDKRRIKDDPDFAVVGGTATETFKTHIPPNTSSIRYFARLRAVGNATPLDSAIVTLNSGGGEQPTRAPSDPTAADRIRNMVDTTTTDPTKPDALVTLRVFASSARDQTGQGGTGTSGRITFADVLADAAYAVIIEDTDTGTIPERFKFGGPINDLTNWFVDIDCPGLVLGKKYKWKLNITTRNGVPFKSNATLVMFTAGSDIFSLTGVTLSFDSITTADKLDRGLTTVRVKVKQPSTPALFKRLKLERKMTSENDSQYKLIDKERLLDMENAFLSNAETIIGFDIKHPKNRDITLRATLVGYKVDGMTNTLVATTTFTSLNEGVFEDTAAPGSVSNINVTLRKGKGLKIRFDLPTTNMNTHVKNTVSLQGANLTYWNPNTGATSGSELEIEIGKSGHITFDVSKRDVITAFGATTLTFVVTIRVYNQFNGSSNSTTTSSAITISTLSETPDVTNMLTNSVNLCPNGTFTLITDLNNVRGWKTSATPGAANLPRSATGDSYFPTSAIFAKLGGRIANTESYTLTFLASGSGTITATIVNEGGAAASNSLAIAISSAPRELYGGTFSISGAGPRTFLQLQGSAIVTKIMLVRGKSPATYTPRVNLENDPGDEGSGFDSAATGSGGTDMGNVPDGFSAAGAKITTI